eukprot:CAMPEP_0201528530 /NCGR_PEP_ID=MMETSP0161_2-20130828/38523_1 /ASSEMBLY_ACC=CAM_ASM_000251 /TAXON_ID=180227 /ORGANISM="Neoparamoeba aestuarina, Strain SoJaBio B1-5/56/2" /LENGTH=283 /DNA_ID=CAMNT_0047929833 /DNA_START=15 /DNA_END=863 /DNA_ORIENTATION=+
MRLAFTTLRQGGAAGGVGRWSSSSSDPLVVEENKNNVRTIRVNRPKTLNAWTQPMMKCLKEKIGDAAQDDQTKVVILTGTDPYYSAGVALNSLIKPMHPRKLFHILEGKNAELFNIFLDFPKPIIAAINGPTIGAATTSATLCDALIASDKATFHTPFAALHIPPEGCSSVHFERIMGQKNANRMLGEEGWKPTGKEAAAIGLATDVVPHEELLSFSQALAEKWIKEGKKREIRNCHDIQEYKQVNLEESRQLATAFFSTEFLMHQYNFLHSKGKEKPARTMW